MYASIDHESYEVMKKNESVYSIKFWSITTCKFVRRFCAKLGRKDVFKPAVWNEGLHDIINDNGIRVVNFATSENLIVKSTLFSHHNIHKYIW